jgi:hypothetical protein
VHSPSGEQLTAKGLLELAEETLKRLPEPILLHGFSEALVEGVHRFHGATGELEDDLTFLTLRRII